MAEIKDTNLIETEASLRGVLEALLKLGKHVSSGGPRGRKKTPSNRRNERARARGEFRGLSRASHGGKKRGTNRGSIDAGGGRHAGTLSELKRGAEPRERVTAARERSALQTLVYSANAAL